MSTAINSNLIKTICDGLAIDGYAVFDEAFPAAVIIALQELIKGLDVAQFSPAGLGRTTGFHTNLKIRSDEIMWIDKSRIENLSYYDWSEALRMALNEQFYLGLFDYECMFAHYPMGAFYQKHVDAFRQSGQQQGNYRKVSTVLYLNSNWLADDGGELLLYHHDHEQPFKSILPELGRLVVFFSDQFPHEVLPGKKSRFSLTGWYRAH